MHEFTGIAHIDALLAEAAASSDEKGHQTRQIFLSGERYLFDARLDLSDGAWAQLDTEDDASYFGIWVNKTARRILLFAEGDLSFTQCADAASYDAQMAAICSFHEASPSFVAITDDAVTAYYQDRSEFFIDPSRGAAYRFVRDDEGGD